MTLVICRDCRYITGKENPEDHQTTSGADPLHQLKKMGRWALWQGLDLLLSPHLPSQWKNDPFYRLLDTTLYKRAKLFTQDNVMTYVQFLKSTYPSASLHFLSGGLGKNTEIKGADPLSAIAGKSNVVIREEEDWLIVEEERSVSKTYPERLIAYPFVYPSKGLCSLPHVVLILIDQAEKILYYYDPQGLTSDDPCRKNLFTDDPEFNMHDNLIQLGKALFPDQEVMLVENIATHQLDPVNCGTLVCRALTRLYQGKSIQEALLFNPLVDSPLYFRRQIGQELLLTETREKGGGL